MLPENSTPTPIDLLDISDQFTFLHNSYIALEALLATPEPEISSLLHVLNHRFSELSELMLVFHRGLKKSSSDCQSVT